MGSRLLQQDRQVPKLTVRLATEDDAQYLASRLRQADVDEVDAAQEMFTPYGVLSTGVYRSRPCMTGLFDGIPAAMFGVTPIPASSSGLIWLLGTDAITDNWRPFLRASRPWLVELSLGYRSLLNAVDERNVAHVRWLQWLGFTFINRRFTSAGLPFLDFVYLCAPPSPR